MTSLDGLETGFLEISTERVFEVYQADVKEAMAADPTLTKEEVSDFFRYYNFWEANRDRLFKRLPHPVARDYEERKSELVASLLGEYYGVDPKKFLDAVEKFFAAEEKMRKRA